MNLKPHPHRERGAIYLFLLLAILLALGAPAPSVAQDATPPADRPGPAVDRLIFRQFDVDRAPLELEAGSMDMYYFSLKIAAARELREQGGFQLFEAPANTLSLLLNPAPAPEGQLNPFSIKEVRQAMQQLIDREFVAREIYLGQAHPMYTHLSPLDFDYLTVNDLVWQLDLRYDPEFARSRIAEAMTEAGAQLTDGVWHYEDQPIRLKLIIRVEDERREVGDLVRSELAEAGFQAEAVYQPFAPAVQTVYSSDPAQLSWHLYTEGWGRGASSRYDFGTVNNMNAPWLGNMPGWRETGFWQYENQALDDLGQRLFRGEFADQAERDEMYREMTRLGLDESVRIWVATTTSTFPARDDLEGVTLDLAAGPRGLWTLRAAHVPGQDTLTVGHAWVWTERTTWNPVGGLGDVYSSDIWRSLQDPPLWNHPFTGIPGPYRAEYEVETAGPSDKLEVPADAVMWDAGRGQWMPVGSGVEATSKVVFDYSRYIGTPWHHGQAMTMADILYSIYQSFDMTYNPDKARVEIALAATSRPFLDTFRGFRVLDENRLEVYVDFWHFEPNLIASYATPAGLSMPWELLYAMDVLVFDERRAAYSDTAAARFSVPWLNLVLDRDARLVRRVLVDLENRGEVPEGVLTLPGGQSVLADEDEAAARYRAALDWFDERGHFIISNGPFTLARYDAAAQYAELHAFRDEAYPFTAQEQTFGQPELVEFAGVEAGTLAPGQPFEARVELAGPGKLGLRYLLLDTAARAVVDEGEAEGSGNEFTVNVPAETTQSMGAGLYQLVLTGYSDELAQITERSEQLQAGLPVPEEPAQAPEETESPPAAAEATAEPAGQAEPGATEPAAVATTAPTPSGGGLPAGLIVGVAVVAVLGVGAGLAYGRRRR